MGCRILGKIARSRNRDQKNGWFENSVADLFSCETSWLGRCVPASVNMARVIRNVLRFNTGKILRFPQKSANWPIPIWCFTTLVAPVFQQLAENIASILFLPTLQRVPLSRISFFSFSFFFFSTRTDIHSFSNGKLLWKSNFPTFHCTKRETSSRYILSFPFLIFLKQILKLISPEKDQFIHT